MLARRSGADVIVVGALRLRLGLNLLLLLLLLLLARGGGPDLVIEGEGVFGGAVALRGGDADAGEDGVPVVGA